MEGAPPGGHRPAAWLRALFLGILGGLIALGLTVSPAAALDGPTGDDLTEATGTAAPAAASGDQILHVARQYVGTPYVWGGATPEGFDCSGFTQYVFAQIGIWLPRTSAQQRYAGQVVPAAEAQPGDLIWWPGHVGIYTGNGQHIAARNPSTLLHESPIWRENPTFIRVG